MDVRGDADWGREIGAIVDGWLFSHAEPLPSVLLVPMENPHLHDDDPWTAVFGPSTSENGVFTVHDADGVRVALARPMLGAAGVAMVVDAASRRGVRTVIGVGFCGGTQPTSTCGDVIAVEQALPGDGVSGQYLPDAVAMRGSSALLGLLHGDDARGRVQSVAAVHLETQADVEACQEAGVLGIDLETAALYAVAERRGLDALSLLTVSDVPARGEPTVPALLVEGHRRSIRLAHALAQAVVGDAQARRTR